MTVVPFPLGVADPSRDLAVILLPDDVVEAFRLSDGATLWRVAQPLRPLAIGATRALVQRLDAPQNVLSLDVLSLDDGRELAACDLVPLPYWSSGVSIDASADGDRFSVAWLAERQYRGGAPPPASVLASEGERVSGTVQIDGGTVATRDESPRDVPDLRVSEAAIGTRTYALAGDALEAREGGRVVWAKRWASSPAPPTARG